MRDEHATSAVHAARCTCRTNKLSEGTILLEFPILGVSVEFSTAEPQLATALEAVYGDWRALRSYPELCVAPARVRVRLELCSVGGKTLQTTQRVEEPNRFYLRTEFARGSADSQRHSAHAIVSARLLTDLERLRVDVLDALTLFLITALDRTPVHAAAIADDDVALALYGARGVGKSTIAHLAAAHGYQVLSDDAVYVQLHPEARVWGVPRLPQPRALGVDVSAPKPARRETRLQFMPPVRSRTGLCLLERGGSDKGELTPLSGDEALALMRASADPGFARFNARLAAPVRALVQGGAWVLQLPDSPGAALPYLAEMMNAVRARRDR